MLRAPLAALFALIVTSFFAAPAYAQDAAPGELAWYAVGRTALNSFTGDTFTYGYFPMINGVKGNMFKGTPNETTAYFTFISAPVKFTTLPQNGTQLITMLPEVTYYIYYSPNPAHSWLDPTSFTRGTLVGAYRRRPGLIAQAGSVLTATFSDYLSAARDFVFQGEVYNFRLMMPGVTTTNTFDLTGNVAGAPIFPFPGFNLVLPLVSTGFKFIPSPGSGFTDPVEITDQPADQPE